MFGYEHERVCFARIDECDGGMSATIIQQRRYLSEQDILHDPKCRAKRLDIRHQVE